jgi:hypothetical protein
MRGRGGEPHLAHGLASAQQAAQQIADRRHQRIAEAGTVALDVVREVEQPRDVRLRRCGVGTYRRDHAPHLLEFGLDLLGVGGCVFGDRRLGAPQHRRHIFRSAGGVVERRAARSWVALLHGASQLSSGGRSDRSMVTPVPSFARPSSVIPVTGRSCIGVPRRLANNRWMPN